MPKLTIDGREIEVPAGATVMQAAQELGVFIPRYCYHPGLSVAGNCRICLVQVEKFPKLQIACNLPATDGMVVHTKNEEAEEGRRSVLEFLLANHPLDCPVCDQAGECDLQNFYMNFGLYNPRFQEQKVKKKKAVELGPHVMLDQERCILCSRCVRFTDEITETCEFGIFNRGDQAELGIVPGEVLDNPYSANVVDICPVGALTERDFRFKTRVWYLSGASTVCNGCSQGCNIDLHYVLNRPHLNDGDRLVRIKPRYNPDVNDWWMCDEGRYGFGWLDTDRLDEVREPNAEPEGAGWEGALSKLSSVLSGARVGVLASAQLTNEELFLVREIFQRSLGARVSVTVPEAETSSDDFLIKADKSPNSHGAALLGLSGPQSPGFGDLVDAALAGEFDVLWVFGHDLVDLLGPDRARQVSERVETLVFSGTNQCGTVELANWVFPTAAYVERDGTFVNCHGRLQRIGRAFPPYKGSREDWRMLLDLARLQGMSFEWSGPEEIFRGLSKAEEAFSGQSFESIGSKGVQITPSVEVKAP
jgi:NADH-quinone oxidoreductase subunit G